MKIEKIIDDLIEESSSLFSKFRDGDIEDFEYPIELEKIREKAITRITNNMVIEEQQQRLDLLEKHVKDFRDILCEVVKNRKKGEIMKDGRFYMIGTCSNGHPIYNQDKQEKAGIVMYYCRYCGKLIKEGDIKKDEK